MPLRWGVYCAYEKAFITDRRNNLLKVWDNVKDILRRDLNVDPDMFEINDLRIWYICYIYANDLKPIRKFHAIDGGCDRPRRAALIARLISKHRPVEFKDTENVKRLIGVPNTDHKQCDPRIKVNELFSLISMFYFIQLKWDGGGENPTTRKMVKELMFIFTHRDPQIEPLVVIARLLRMLYV
jgi:hypothetical protein